MHCLILFTNVPFRKCASMFTCFLLWIYVLLSLYKVLKYFYSLFLAFYWISQLIFVPLFLLMVETSISLLVITSTFKLLLYGWVKSLSHVWLFATLWSVAYQAPLSMGFSRQEYWSGLPLPFPGNLPDPGIEPTSPALQVDSSPLSHLGSPINKTNNLTIKERQKTYRNILSTLKALLCTSFHVSHGTSARTVPWRQHCPSDRNYHPPL